MRVPSGEIAKESEGTNGIVFPGTIAVPLSPLEIANASLNDPSNSTTLTSVELSKISNR